MDVENEDNIDVYKNSTLFKKDFVKRKAGEYKKSYEIKNGKSTTNYILDNTKSDKLQF